LHELLGWTQSQFEQRMEGSAIRRIGHERFLRNVAVALGNGPASESALTALRARQHDASELVREHVLWALQRLQGETAQTLPAASGV
jgi:epoxyqueuosine reductase